MCRSEGRRYSERNFLTQGLNQICKRHPQFLGGTEQAILGRLFCRAAQFADGAQPQTLVVLQLEHHTLPWIESVQRLFDAAADLSSAVDLLRIKLRTVICHGQKEL